MAIQIDDLLLIERNGVVMKTTAAAVIVGDPVLVAEDLLLVERDGVAYQLPALEASAFVTTPQGLPPTPVSQGPVYVGEKTANGGVPILPTLVGGDLAVVVAFASTATPPVVPSGWVNAFQSSDAGGGLSIGWQIAPVTNANGQWSGSNGIICMNIRNADPAKPMGTIEANFSTDAAAEGSAPMPVLQDSSGASLVMSGINLQTVQVFSGNPIGWVSVSNGTRFSFGWKEDTADMGSLSYTKQFSIAQTWRGYSFEVLKKPA